MQEVESALFVMHQKRADGPGICKQGRVGFADRPAPGEQVIVTASGQVTLKQLQLGLRTARQEGDVRVAIQPKEKAKCRR